MAYIAITPPAQGDPTKASLASALAGNDAYFFQQVAGIKALGIPNGSYELDSDADGIPDGWVRTVSGGVTGARDTNTATADVTGRAHGSSSFKFTMPGANAGATGTLESEDYFEVTNCRDFHISWLAKFGASTLNAAITVRWYDNTKAFISSATLFSSATGLPTTEFAMFSGGARLPSTARYAKIRITMTDNATAGVAYFDDFRIGVEFPNKVQFVRTAQTGGFASWKAPSSIYCVRVTCVGAGGGGAGAPLGSSIGGGGGGGGGMGVKYVLVAPASVYAVSVGAGGDGGLTTTDGTAGANSTFASTVVIGNGGGGAVDGGGSGAGGTGGSGTGDIVTTGTAGTGGSSGDTGGDGGASSMGGGGNGSTTAGFSGGDGSVFGGGGGGCGESSSATGGDGGHGLVMIEW